MHSREECSLKPPNKEAVRSQLGVRCDAELKECENAPYYVEKRNEPLHRDVSEEEQEGQLSHHGPYDVERLQLNQLIPVESQVLLEPTDVSII